MQPCHDPDGPQASQCVTVAVAYARQGPERCRRRSMWQYEGFQRQARLTCLRDWADGHLWDLMECRALNPPEAIILKSKDGPQNFLSAPHSHLCFQVRPGGTPAVHRLTESPASSWWSADTRAAALPCPAPGRPCMASRGPWQGSHDGGMASGPVYPGYVPQLAVFDCASSQQFAGPPCSSSSAHNLSNGHLRRHCQDRRGCRCR